MIPDQLMRFLHEKEKELRLRNHAIAVASEIVVNHSPEHWDAKVDELAMAIKQQFLGIPAELRPGYPSKK